MTHLSKIQMILKESGIAFTLAVYEGTIELGIKNGAMFVFSEEGKLLFIMPPESYS